MTNTTQKVRVVLSELTNTLYLATKKDKRELNKQELDLIKYKFEKDNECQECNLIGKDNCSTHCFNNLPKSISREKVNGFKGELHFERIGSSCCGAKVIDPGNTGEGLCSSCKEHCEEDYIQDVDVAVLNFAGKPEVQIFRIEYESASDEYEDIEGCVHQFLLEKFGGTSNLEFMRSEVNPIKVLDHRD